MQNQSKRASRLFLILLTMVVTVITIFSIKNSAWSISSPTKKGVQERDSMINR